MEPPQADPLPEDEAALADSLKCGFTEQLRNLSQTAIHEVAGNGMHLRVVSASMLFIFACAADARDAMTD